MKTYSIKVNNVSKCYQIQTKKQPYRLLSEDFFNLFKKKINAKLFKALQNVSFEVKKGEVVGIIGANGSGKSTLLKILSKITYPTSGNVELKGRVASLLEIGTGFNPELSGRENIYLNGSILGMKRKMIDEKLEEIINFAGVRSFIDEPIKHYSSGMQVRLAFSVMTNLQSDILLVDEVLAVGDAEFQKKSLGKMNDVVKNKNKTILFVSHDLDTVKKLCTKTILLEKGKMLKYGPTNAVINFYLSRISKNTLNLGTRLVKNKSRLGSGEIVIKRIKMIDKNGKLKRSVNSGEDLYLKMDFSVKRGLKIRDLLVGILFKSEVGTPIFVSHNYLYGNHFNEVSGEGSFLLKIPNLPLNNGNYYINCSFVKNGGLGGEFYDNIDDAFKLTVGYGDFFGSSQLPLKPHGSALVKGDWQLIK